MYGWLLRSACDLELIARRVEDSIGVKCEHVGEECLRIDDGLVEFGDGAWRVLQDGWLVFLVEGFGFGS